MAIRAGQSSRSMDPPAPGRTPLPHLEVTVEDLFGVHVLECEHHLGCIEAGVLLPHPTQGSGSEWGSSYAMGEPNGARSPLSLTDTWNGAPLNASSRQVTVRPLHRPHTSLDEGSSSDIMPCPQAAGCPRRLQAISHLPWSLRREKNSPPATNSMARYIETSSWKVPRSLTRKGCCSCSSSLRSSSACFTCERHGDNGHSFEGDRP